MVYRSQQRSHNGLRSSETYLLKERPDYRKCREKVLAEGTRIEELRKGKGVPGKS